MGHYSILASYASIPRFLAEIVATFASGKSVLVHILQTSCGFSRKIGVGSSAYFSNYFEVRVFL